MVKQVPVEVLSTAMVPPCFSTICRGTQSPSPVPSSALVVKKGSKIRARFSAGIPGPLSKTRSCTPPSESVVATRMVPPPGSTSTALATRLAITCRSSPLEPRTGWECSICMYTDVLGPQLGFVQGNHLAHQFAQVHRRRSAALAIKAESHFRNVRDAGKLFLHHVQVAADFSFRGGARQVNQVSDRFKGIVNLVSDGGGQAT